MSIEPLIRLEGVRKVFFTDEVETHALSGIHLEIQRGEYVSIEGPSGCGKSTLLSILGLLDSPSDGSYVLNPSTAERDLRSLEGVYIVRFWGPDRDPAAEAFAGRFAARYGYPPEQADAFTYDAVMLAGAFSSGRSVPSVVERTPDIVATLRMSAS